MQKRECTPCILLSSPSNLIFIFILFLIWTERSSRISVSILLCCINITILHQYCHFASILPFCQPCVHIGIKGSYEGNTLLFRTSKIIQLIEASTVFGYGRDIGGVPYICDQMLKCWIKRFVILIYCWNFGSWELFTSLLVPCNKLMPSFGCRIVNQSPSRGIIKIWGEREREILESIGTEDGLPFQVEENLICFLCNARKHFT